jgi:type IV secretion system protein VirD4
MYTPQTHAQRPTVATNWFEQIESDEKRIKKYPDENKELFGKILVWLVGAYFPLVAFFALRGFKSAYRRAELSEEGIPPTLWSARPICYIYAIGYAVLFGLGSTKLLQWIWEAQSVETIKIFAYLVNGIGFIFLLINLVIMFFVMRRFDVWQRQMTNYVTEARRHGTARFAYPEETAPLRAFAKGLYIGENTYYNKAGHILTVAGTRAGKGVNLIIPNLLSIGKFKGSWVIIDPKGENAAVTARAQRESGRNVVILNPWQLLETRLGESATYNPFDLLKMDRLNLSDDVQMIAETIVPIAAGGQDDHFNNRARSVISSLLLHLVTARPDAEKHLGTLWEWLRADGDAWDTLLVQMSKNQDTNAGDIVRASASELLSLMEKSAREYGSIISTAQKWTDFLKSPALRDSLTSSSGFTSADLADGNTTVYVIIPADRLKTHYQWLRLVVSSLMRSVVRNPKEDVCFLLDEFYALGYLSEIETALGTYAGYGIHVWAILQNLVQLKDTYGNNWENFVSSCSVRHFFNVSDNTTADYVSHLFGQMSVHTYDADGNVNGASSRPLVSSDELRRTSGNVIYTVIDQLPPAIIQKAPYYEMPDSYLLPYDTNPYLTKG